EDPEDSGVVVQALADHAVLQIRRVAEGAIGLLQALEGHAGGQVSIGGLHGHDAVDDGAEKLDRVVARHDGVRPALLHAAGPAAGRRWAACRDAARAVAARWSSTESSPATMAFDGSYCTPKCTRSSIRSSRARNTSRRWANSG